MIDALAARFRRFAETEAREHSPLYEALASGVAGDRAALEFVASLPRAKQQPNLLFAALRRACGTPADWTQARAGLRSRADAIHAVMLARDTQTNEPGRCAVLLPVLASLKQPLALIEVGASAGLCLLADRYMYDYQGRILRGPAAPDHAPLLVCRIGDTTPIPRSVPQVVWRVGLDLNPVDLTDDDQVAWLETLVWPDQPHRLARLRAAISVARADPSRVVQGNLLTDLPALVAEAPPDATLVVFHTAVLAYVADPDMRAAFARTVLDLGAIWICNEAPLVFPDIAAKAATSPARGAFLLAVNETPLAWTDPHGAWMEWIGGTRDADVRDHDGPE
jgi:hypothetical protein